MFFFNCNLRVYSRVVYSAQNFDTSRRYYEVMVLKSFAQMEQGQYNNSNNSYINDNSISS